MKICEFREPMPAETLKRMEYPAGIDAEFHNSADDYPSVCKEENREPEKSYKGSFNIRFKDPLLHKHASVYAFQDTTSLNSIAEESVKMFI